jgi:hypothetical protein
MTSVSIFDSPILPKSLIREPTQKFFCLKNNCYTNSNLSQEKKETKQAKNLF